MFWGSRLTVGCAEMVFSSAPATNLDLTDWFKCGVAASLAAATLGIGGAATIFSGTAASLPAAAAFGVTATAAGVACGTAGDNSRILKNGCAKFTGDKTLVIEADKVGLIDGPRFN